ncbi:hypothetical protein CEXT_627161 [Caerostris extrusa]|uniref:Uncharacterized protein n=1 Tax=Caerostris extrusa TaxID=172846 RepID=A0AAV4X0X2_CAEEX|nr:hypothetical protein CEXT_627161 [Caerostris extrusa]
MQWRSQVHVHGFGESTRRCHSCQFSRRHTVRQNLGLTITCACLTLPASAGQTRLLSARCSNPLARGPYSSSSGQYDVDDESAEAITFRAHTHVGLTSFGMTRSVLSWPAFRFVASPRFRPELSPWWRYAESLGNLVKLQALSASAKCPNTCLFEITPESTQILLLHNQSGFKLSTLL